MEGVSNDGLRIAPADDDGPLPTDALDVYFWLRVWDDPPRPPVRIVNAIGFSLEHPASRWRVVLSADVGPRPGDGVVWRRTSAEEGSLGFKLYGVGRWPALLMSSTTVRGSGVEQFRMTTAAAASLVNRCLSFERFKLLTRTAATVEPARCRVAIEKIEAAARLVADPRHGDDIRAVSTDILRAALEWPAGPPPWPKPPTGPGNPGVMAA